MGHTHSSKLWSLITNDNIGDLAVFLRVLWSGAWVRVPGTGVGVRVPDARGASVKPSASPIRDALMLGQQRPVKPLTRWLVDDRRICHPWFDRSPTAIGEVTKDVPPVVWRWSQRFYVFIASCVCFLTSMHKHLRRICHTWEHVYCDTGPMKMGAHFWKKK